MAAFLDTDLDDVMGYWSSIARQPEMHQEYLIWKDSIVAAPLVFAGTAFDEVKKAVAQISSLLFDLTAVRFAGNRRHHAEALAFEEEEIRFHEAYSHVETNPCAIARPDCIVRGRRPIVLEFNVGGNVGGLVSTDLHGAQLMKRCFQVSMPTIHFDSVLTPIIAMYRRLSCQESPRIALLEWRDRVDLDSPAGSVNRLQGLLEMYGLECVVADPRDAIFVDGKCRINGRAVDLAHRFFSWSLDDLKPGGRMPQAWISAVSSGDIPFVGWRTSKLWGSKANLAVMSEMLESSSFSEHHGIIEATIPWTRFLAASKLAHKHLQMLTQHAISNQNQLVLKKATGTDDGRDVVIGAFVTKAHWLAAVHKAIGANWILQQFVEPVTAAFPVVDLNSCELTHKDLYYIVSPFVIDRRVVTGGWVRGQSSPGPTHGQFGHVRTTCVAVDRRI